MFSFIVFLFVNLSIYSGAHAATRYFAIDVTWERRAADGYTRGQIVVNGTSPGPALIVDEGDDVEFLVRNHLSDNTVVHFHGIYQLNTPWSDGVGGLSQRPIPAGGEFLYKWTATEYGTYWYHSHYRSQISDGLYGPIYVRPRASQPRPFTLISNDTEDLAAMMRAEQDPKLIVLSDWTHVNSSTMIAYSHETNLDIPCSNSLLVNGKGSVNCMTRQEQEDAVDPAFRSSYTDPDTGEWIATPNGCSVYSPVIQGNYTVDYGGLPGIVTDCCATQYPREVIEADAGQKWISLNFISSASIQAPIVTIDGHSLWVYAVDGRYIEPVLVDGFQIFNGNRYSVMVKLDQEPGLYTLRAIHYGANQLINGFATLSYNDSHKTIQPTPFFGPGGVRSSPEVTLLNETNLRPFENIPPSMNVSQTHVLQVARVGAPWIWKLDDVPYPQLPVEYAEDMPLLYYPYGANALNQSLTIRTMNDTWVDIVFVVVDFASPPHPMHKHSNKAYIIGQGTNWNWTTVAEAAAAQPESFNFENPILRDGFTTPAVTTNATTWLAIRYHVVNPGAFFLHCHIQPHLTGGMALAIWDGVDVPPQIPAEYSIDGNGIVA